MKYSGAKYTQGVKFSKRKGMAFIQNRMKLDFQISDSDWVRAICIHEAAHIFYFRQFGATEFIYHGPRMDYIRESAAYAVMCAGVEPKPYTKKPRTLTEMLELQARLAVSGSVAAASFTTPEEDGAQDDYARFKSLCAEINVKDPKACWDKARPEVEADFRLPENRAIIINEAEKVRVQVFPWATLPIVDIDSHQNETPNRP